MPPRCKFPVQRKQESATSLGKIGLAHQIVEVVAIQLFPFALERSRLGWVPFPSAGYPDQIANLDEET